MRHHPPLTIGMPIRNAEVDLERAVNSLLAQEFGDFRIVISDNCSSDGTADLCREIVKNDSRVSYHRQGEDVGAANNFRFVFEMSESPLFMFAAHDDFWSPNHLSLAQEHFPSLQTRPGVYSSNWFVGDLEKMTGFSHVNHLLGDIQTHSPQERVKAFVNLHHWSHKCNLVYGLGSSELFRYAFDRVSLANDGLFCAVLLYKGDLSVSNEVTFFKDYRGPIPTVDSRIHVRSMLKRWLYGHLGLRSAVNFRRAKRKALEEFTEIFPELEDYVREVFRSYRQVPNRSGFRISE